MEISPVLRTLLSETPGFFCCLKKKKGVPDHGATGDAMEIEIPVWLTEALLRYAAASELTVEEIVERAIKSYLERNDEND